MKNLSVVNFGQGVEYVLVNFATPICFYLAFRYWGAKPAIGLAVGTTTAQWIYHKAFRLKVTPFFLIGSGFTVGFGTIDLLIQSPTVFRFEPFAQNFIIATVLMLTVFRKVPTLYYFAEALPEKVRPDLVGEGSIAYLRKLTWIWIIYLYFKAFAFLYFAFNVELGNLILLRSLVGGGSLILLFLGELIYRKWIRQKRIRRTP